ncbi:hypothetical protein Ddye_019162 [Dipteronia dyeriana]|uniref:Uncharacterized protein n=1 Tax=Dipteronia dyeriana TaxID=168575 RepID=A0AAD9WVG4_9ROSI|nr:hypothetical protein Ddye_019162 [Dipteronia dyeriana]
MYSIILQLVCTLAATTSFPDFQTSKTSFPGQKRSTINNLHDNHGSQADKRPYEVKYGDGFYTKGTLMLETLTIGQMVILNMAIGCGHKMTRTRTKDMDQHPSLNNPAPATENVPRFLCPHPMTMFWITVSPIITALPVSVAKYWYVGGLPTPTRTNYSPILRIHENDVFDVVLKIRIGGTCSFFWQFEEAVTSSGSRKSISSDRRRNCRFRRHHGGSTLLPPKTGGNGLLYGGDLAS